MATECTVCGKSLAPSPRSPPGGKLIRTAQWEKTVGYEDAPHQAHRVAWASIGGILIILAGILGIVHMAFTAEIAEELDLIDSDSLVCIGLWAIFAILAIMGGVFAMMRVQLPLAIIGGIAGILAIGCILGAILSLIGLIMVAVAAKEFGAPS